MHFFLLLILGFTLSSTPAHAYIDPGSSLLLLQGLFAFLGGLLVFVKNPIKAMKALLKRLRGEKDA